MTLHIAAQIIADCGENCKITVCTLHPITHAHRVAHHFLSTGEDDVLPTMRTGISGFVDGMAGDAEHLSVQDSIIVASLDSISGKHCLQIKNLFVHAGIFAGIAHFTACATHMCCSCHQHCICLFRGPAYSSGCLRCVVHRHSRRTHIRIVAGAQALNDDAEAVAVDIGEAKLVP